MIIEIEGHNLWFWYYLIAYAVAHLIYHTLARFKVKIKRR